MNIGSRMNIGVKHNRSYDVSLVAPALEQLHAHVTRADARVEITRPGTDDRCVLISKRELDALERALEILSDTDGAKAISHKIAQLASQTGPQAFAQMG
jgi:hypothetical protein